MKQYVVKLTALCTMAIFLSYAGVQAGSVNGSGTGTTATGCRSIPLIKPDQSLATLEETVTEDDATTLFAEQGEAGLTQALENEGADAAESLSGTLETMEYTGHPLTTPPPETFGYLRDFNKFYYSVAGCANNSEAKKVTDAIRERDAKTAFFAAQFSDPGKANQLAGTSTYGGWGDVHFVAPGGKSDPNSFDYHGKDTWFTQIMSNATTQVTIGLDKWGGSPATITTAFHIRSMDDKKNEYRITVGLKGIVNNAIKIAPGGTITKLHINKGRNVISPNLVMDYAGKGQTSTIYTPNYSLSMQPGGDKYMNFTAHQTGSVFEGAVSLDGILGGQMARKYSGSKAPMKPVTGGAYSTVFQQVDPWTSFGGFGKTQHPVPDGSGYIPTYALLKVGGFKQPDGKPAFQPNQICH